MAPVYTRVVTQRPDTTARPEATARSARTLPVATMPLTEVAPGESPKRQKTAPPVAAARKPRRAPVKTRSRREAPAGRAKAGARRRAR